MRDPTATLPERISAAIAFASTSYLFIDFELSLRERRCCRKRIVICFHGAGVYFLMLRTGRKASSFGATVTIVRQLFGLLSRSDVISLAGGFPCVAALDLNALRGATRTPRHDPSLSPSIT
jgi:hypothetical protein